MAQTNNKVPIFAICVGAGWYVTPQLEVLRAWVPAPRDGETPREYLERIVERANGTLSVDDTLSVDELLDWRTPPPESALLGAVVRTAYTGRARIALGATDWPNAVLSSEHLIEIDEEDAESEKAKNREAAPQSPGRPRWSANEW